MLFVPVTSVVCADFPTGLSIIVKRFGVLTVVFLRSRLTVLKRTRSIDSRGELILLLKEPMGSVRQQMGMLSLGVLTRGRLYGTATLQNRV